jgi:hypothetical protein
MANLGKICFTTLVLLFMLKAVTASVLPFFMFELQELAIEAPTDQQESDEQIEFKFLDEYLKLDEVLSVFHLPFNLKSKENFHAYNAAITLGFIAHALKPPSVS